MLDDEPIISEEKIENLLMVLRLEQKKLLEARELSNYKIKLIDIELAAINRSLYVFSEGIQSEMKECSQTLIDMNIIKEEDN